MKALYLTIIVFSFTLTTFSQIDSTIYRIYDFINSIDRIETKAETYLKENGSPKYLLKGKDALDFDHRHCMFLDGSFYSDTIFWNENLNQEDKEYMISQIHELKKFKWEKDRVKKDLKLITKSEVKKYSRNAMKHWEGKSEVNDFSFKMLIGYSAPVFNKNHNLALVYSSTYSGPLSASWEIDIYLLKDGKWIYIGHDPKGMS